MPVASGRPRPSWRCCAGRASRSASCPARRTSQMMLSVGAFSDRVDDAVRGSGKRSMSLSLIFWKPRMTSRRSRCPRTRGSRRTRTRSGAARSGRLEITVRRSSGDPRRPPSDAPRTPDSGARTPGGMRGPNSLTGWAPAPIEFQQVEHASIVVEAIATPLRGIRTHAKPPRGSLASCCRPRRRAARGQSGRNSGKAFVHAAQTSAPPRRVPGRGAGPRACRTLYGACTCFGTRGRHGDLPLQYVAMAKYDALRDYLASLPRGQKRITMGFAKIEEVLGASLPPSAHLYEDWWHGGTRWSKVVTVRPWENRLGRRRPERARAKLVTFRKQDQLRSSLSSPRVVFEPARNRPDPGRHVGPSRGPGFLAALRNDDLKAG